MRPINSATVTAASLDVTTPIALVEIGDPITERYSTRGEQTHNAATYQPGATRIITGDSADGNSTIEVALDNTDGALTAAALDGSYIGRRLRVHISYDPDLSVVETLFDGNITNHPDINNTLVISAESAPAKSDDDDQIAGQLAQYAGAFIADTGSALRLVPNRPTSPVSTLTAADFRPGTFSISRPEPPHTVVRVEFTNTAVWPWAPDTLTLAETGVSSGDKPWRETSISVPGVTSPKQAKRIALQSLNRARLIGLIAEWESYDETLQYLRGDVVTIDYAPLNITGLDVRILSLRQTAIGRWAITAEKYAPALWSDDATGTQTIYSPQLILPNHIDAPTIEAVTTEWTQPTDGSLTYQLAVTTTPPADPHYRRTIVEFREQITGQSAEDGWRIAVTTDTANVATCQNCQDGQPYEIRARAENYYNILSDWTQITPATVDTKAAPPPAPTSVSAYSRSDGFRVININQPQLPSDYAGTEAQYQADDNSWQAIPGDLNLADARQLETGVIPNGERSIRARNIDATGNVSTWTASDSIQFGPDPDQVISSLETATADVNTLAAEAQARADDAYSRANAAQDRADQAVIDAAQADADAATAQQVADDAAANADAAIANANSAATTASNAQQIANNAITIANTADTVANNATNIANTANTAAQNAQSTADNATAIGQNAEAIGQNARAIADLKIRTWRQSYAPSAGEYGDIWYNSGDQNRPYHWDGGNWVDARDGKIYNVENTANSANNVANNAQNTADSAMTTAQAADWEARNGSITAGRITTGRISFAGGGFIDLDAGYGLSVVLESSSGGLKLYNNGRIESSEKAWLYAGLAVYSSFTAYGDAAVQSDLYVSGAITTNNGITNNGWMNCNSRLNFSPWDAYIPDGRVLWNDHDTNCFLDAAIRSVLSDIGLI